LSRFDCSAAKPDVISSKTVFASTWPGRFASAAPARAAAPRGFPTNRRDRARLRKVPEELRLAWEATAHAVDESPPEPSRWTRATIPEQLAIMVTCRREAEQVELLSRFHDEGLDCRAPLS